MRQVAGPATFKIITRLDVQEFNDHAILVEQQPRRIFRKSRPEKWLVDDEMLARLRLLNDREPLALRAWADW